MWRLQCWGDWRRSGSVIGGLEGGEGAVGIVAEDAERNAPRSLAHKHPPSGKYRRYTGIQ